MAPIMRRSHSGGGVAKQVHRKRVTRKETFDSWELVQPQKSHDDDDDMFMEEAQDERQLTIDGLTDFEDAANPLREMAERVGREVETFAETLDRFFADLPTTANKFGAARDLVVDFKDIADEAVHALKQNYERERLLELRKEWSEQARISTASTGLKTFQAPAQAPPLSARKAEQVNRLRQWQREADIWELFRIMMDMHPPKDGREVQERGKQDKLAQFGRPHRYTSTADLWERFVLENDAARERHLIKSWLENTVDHQDSDVASIVEELEAKAGRGKGLWSSGWMHTREKIKGEKRLRSWPNAADSPLPQIRRSDNNELLITTLDPDAPSRQQRTLEKPDSYLERATWIACWEMLRRGKDFQEICEWCEERREGWRAVCMGRAMDLTDYSASDATWRRVCFVASQSGCSSEYEAAVMGLLGGSVRAVQKVCKTVDDELYAHYNAVLLRQFDQYILKVCPAKATPLISHHAASTDAEDLETSEKAVANLVDRLRRGQATKSEASQPMKMIQGFLLADEAVDLVYQTGVALAATAKLQLEEGVAEADLFQLQHPTSGNEVIATEVALDPQTLRIVAHIGLVIRAFEPSDLEGEKLAIDENVLVAYIQALRAAGKRDLIPLYASKLQPARYVKVLGRVLQDVTEAKEQGELLQLLQEYDLDVVGILGEQLRWTMQSLIGSDALEKPLSILENTDDTKIWPGQRIRLDFLPDEVAEDDEAIVRCLQWFQLLHGHWDVTFEALTLAMRKCLITGRFACARMIVQNFPYEDVSLRKSYETMRQSVNLIENFASVSSDGQEHLQWDLLRRQSIAYYELEHLVRAVEELSSWRAEEQIYLDKAPKPSNVPTVLKRAKESVTESMEPILKGILLHPLDDAEAADLNHIRTAYVPEVIIAYNTVLHAAGNLITRDNLLESMDLSATIAEDENGLTDCFVRARRMRELVTSFALTSKVMLVLKAEGKPWKAKKDREGKDLGIWEIGTRSGMEVES